MKGNEINQIDHYSLSNVQIPSNSSIPKLTTAQELLVDKFSIELSQIKKKKKIELAIGDKVQLLFSIIESRFRIFTNCLDPTACKNGMDSFKNTYQWLLKKLDKQEQYLEILEFFQLLRNTIHNNGVYRNIKEPSKQVFYSDKLFTFEQGKPVLLDNLYNLLFFELTPDLLNMVNDIINSSQILKIGYIEDPISK